MLKCLWSACAALVIFGSGLGGSTSLAKPPDLPANLEVDFDVNKEESETEGNITLGVDLFSGNWSLSFSFPWNVLSSWLADAPKAVKTTKVRDKTKAGEQNPISLEEMQARALFTIAESCLSKGDIDKARTCYEETHLTAPASACGRQAMQRLAELDGIRINALMGNAEER
jgi:hypothetical protein